MMAITFDGPTKIVQLDTTTQFYSAGYIYSRWKDWVTQSDNSKYLEAFRIVGGDDLGGGQAAPYFVFLRNDYGWRIKKPEADINVTINGNLVEQVPGAGFDLPPDGAFSPTLTINLTSVSSVDASSLNKILDILESDEEYNSTKAIRRHKTTKAVLIEKDRIGGTDPVSTITLTEVP